MAENGAVLYKPLGLLAELTHRCPLGCPYCSNPLALDPRGSELDTQTWARVFAEAAALGVLQVHLSGGEPGARRDLVAIMAAAHAAGLYTNLITSAVGIALGTFRQLAEAGLDHVQISIQDSERASADRIAGYDGAFARKCALAAEVAPRHEDVAALAVDTMRPTPTGGCEFRRFRRATVLANIDGNRTQLPCINRSASAR